MDILGLLTTNYAVAFAVFLPIVIYLYWLQTRNDDYWKKKGVPYEPRASWFYLIYALFTKHLHEMETDRFRKLGRIYGGFEGVQPNITVGDPDVLRDVLVKDFQFFSRRREFDMKLDPVIGNMVSVLNGEDWKRVRTIITPAFTSGKMRKMTNIINDCSKTVIDTFIRNANEGTQVDIKRAFGAYTMDVIASSAFATKINSHEDPNNPFVVQAYNAFNRNATLRMIAFFLIPQVLWRIFRLSFVDYESTNFFRSVTLQVIEERRKKGQRGNDFLQLMMDSYKEQLETDNKVDGFKMMDLDDDDEKDVYGHAEINKQVFKAIYNNRSLSQDELLAQCILFFMVGYETTASTLSFLAYSIACNPEVQEKLIQEVDQTFKGNDELTYDVIRDMKYLDCVVSETLRMYPPLIRAERTAVEDYKVADKGITISKGMVVGIPIYAMHQDPEFFHEPEKFKPERFLPENISHPSYAYLPFGAGPRNCLGMRFALMEIKLCIANALRRVRFKTCPETKIPLDFAMTQGFLSPKGLVVKVEERKDVP